MIHVTTHEQINKLKAGVTNGANKVDTLVIATDNATLALAR